MIRVHSYESMGTFDGPGLRLVVFLQGCPFRCLYCANPDTIDSVGDATMTNPDYILDMAVDQKPFFGKRGGITFSGGEPTVQAKELIPLFEKLRDAGIHICVDTNGSIRNANVDRLLELTDLVLLDVKQINNDKHNALTGTDNTRTLETAAWLRKNNRPMWLRYVLVPGISDDPADIEAWGRYFTDYENIERVEILPYHTLGVHKYAAMNLRYALEGTPHNTPQQLAAAREILGRHISAPIYIN